MIARRYTVVPYGERWKLSTEKLQLGLYDTRDEAVRAGTEAAHEAQENGIEAELQVLDYYGELSQSDLTRQPILDV